MAPFIIIAIVILGLILLVSNKLRYDIIALLLLSVSLITGVVPLDMAYVGFMNPAVTSVACIMVITRALIHSNILYLFTNKTSHLMKSQVGHITILVLLTTFFSMFMNNVGALSLVLPIAVKTADEMNHSRSAVLMPMAFGAGLGGLCTSFGTPPNLIISNFRREALSAPFSVFDFTPVGLTVTVVGVLFLILFGWRLVRKKGDLVKTKKNSDQYICEVILKENSPIIGKTLNEVNQKDHFPFKIFDVFERGEVCKNSKRKFEQHDRLMINMQVKDLESLVHKYKVQFRLLNHPEHKEYHFVEAVVVKGSRLIGRELKDLNLSGRFDFNIIGVRQSEEEKEHLLEKKSLQAGDAVIIATKQEKLNKHTNYLGLLLVNWLDPIKEIEFKNFLPLIFFLFTITLNILKIIPLPVALGFSVLLIILTKALPLRLLYESVNWPVIILLAAMIPIAQSFQSTGGAELISNLFVNVFCKCHPIVLLSLIMLITIFLSDLINNTATALIMAPIAIDVAKSASLSIDTFLMAVAIGASCSFATPIGHQNNVIIYNIGKYKFSDYLRLGIPLEFVVFGVALLSLLYFWPIYA
ncbi:MAG: hypothetical protein S4CHLAM6_00500 [Chlamydiae bacterium]|nr:hypothetical protein [Chlamydiota bacterium]